jgi:hypothetical protein
VAFIDPVGSPDILGDCDAFPDRRLFARVPKAIKALLAKFCEPPSQIARALRRGISRFITNKRLNGARLVTHVLTENARQLCEFSEVVIAHDSSEIDKHGRGVPSDAGPLRSSQSRGYLVHLAVAASFDGALFGAVDAFAWARSWLLRQGDHNSRPKHQRESHKWDRGIERTEQRLRELGFSGTVFHTEDREADDYEHLATQQTRGRYLIVRRDLSRKRSIAAEPVLDEHGHPDPRWIPLEQKLNAIPYRRSYEVEVDSRRTDRAGGLTHALRTATVSYRFCEVTLQAPRRSRTRATPSLTLWIVEVKERQPPANSVPLHWQLFSLFPVRTEQDAERVIQVYKRRWKCEDYIKIAKSGCQLESQHVDRLASFKRLLALSLGAANQLARMVAASRQNSAQPLSEVLDPQMLEAILDAADYHHVAVPEGLTVSEGLLVIGKIGGFEWCKGRVLGWLVLTRGWARVLEHQAIVARDRLRRQRPP